MKALDKSCFFDRGYFFRGDWRAIQDAWDEVVHIVAGESGEVVGMVEVALGEVDVQRDGYKSMIMSALPPGDGHRDKGSQTV